MQLIQVNRNNITASGQRVAEGQKLVVGRDINLRDAKFLVQSSGAKEILQQMKAPRQRTYAGAANKDILSNFRPSQLSANEEVYPALVTLRDRARSLIRDDPWAVQYIQMSVSNIVGQNGIVLQAKVPNRSRTGRKKNPLDSRANELIEGAFKEWGKKGTCTVCGQYSWRGLQEAVVRAESSDGEVFVRKVENYPNKFRYALQLIESDHCDHELNTKLSNGNHIIMGIEIDGFGKPVRYWFLTSHPGDRMFIRWHGKQYISYPASEIIHVFKPQRPGQLRGVPHLAPVMITTKMLDGYQEAELVAARSEASQPYWIEQTTPEGWQGDDTRSNGSLINEIEPGIMNILEPGQSIKSPDLTRPGTMYASFIKANLRAISSGLGIAYNGMANDLEGVNFSSMRSGSLQERDNWKVRQQFIIETLCEPAYQDWLRLALRTQLTMLSASRYTEYLVVRWQARGWDWVDPKKDIEAAVLAIDNRIASPQQYVTAQGRHYPDVIAELAAAKEIQEAAGLTTEEVIASGAEEEDNG